jgi:uncharacterized protein with NAD-binding domain and iron-sulfur cluster
MGALSAAAALTQTPALRAKHDVTVLQSAFRLGGKGASGRNAAHHHRIEEHGFHLLFGFYDNTFGLLRSIYTELGRKPGEVLSELVATDPAIEAAFPGRFALRRHDNIVHFESFGGGSRSFPVSFPRNAALPGDAPGEADASGAIAVAAHWMRALRELEREVFAEGGLRRALRTARDLAAIGVAAPDLWAAARVSAASAPPPIRLALRAWGTLGATGRERLRRAAVSRLQSRLRSLWHELGSRVESDFAAYRLWTLQDWLATQTIGILRDDLVRRGFDAVDDEDYREWLMRHATVPQGTAVTLRSSWVRGAYDSCFAYVTRPEGPTPSMSAAAMLRGGLRLNLGYKGAVSYMFQAGTGDVIFAPLYEVLRRRGVRFAFFHRVDRLVVGPGPSLDRIEVGVQARVRAGWDGYEPLVAVNGLSCWPSEPRWDLLEAGDELRASGVELESEDSPTVERKRLERGRDFDDVVLGIPVGALPRITGDIARASPRWSAMLAHIATTATVGHQVWLRARAEELHGAAGGFNADTGRWPYATSADMTDVVAREGWLPHDRPAHLAYFCGAVEDVAGETAEQARSREQLRARAWIERETVALWPQAHAKGRFDEELFVGAGPAPTCGSGQFTTLNAEPSARYTLSLPGSARYRLRADESGVAHLFLAGDWTKNGLDSGCMEASVMSGMQAARAICGEPTRVPGERDFD